MLLNESADNLVKVTFEFALNPPKGKEKYDYKDLVNFLDQIEQIHENAIKFCYDENTRNSADERLFLEQFSLKLDNVFLKNNLNISISFDIHIDTVIPYYFALKILLNICEKYGSNTKHLRKTIEEFLMCLRDYLNKNKFLIKRIGPKTMDLIFNHEKSDYLREFEKLLNDRQFKRLYNSICKSALSFRKITANFKFYDKTKEDTLIENYVN